MAGNTFFRKAFDSKIVDFGGPQESWMLGEKIQETNHRLDEFDSARFKASSFACAVYHCTSSVDRTQEAIMKIYLQVPYIGSEMHTPEEREVQAKPDLRSAKSELQSLIHWTEKGCLSTPKLLAHRQDTQDPQGFVPGGYAIYLLMERLPGRRLGEGFWELSEAERNDIRERFKGAWVDCLFAGLVPAMGNLSEIMWDPVTGRVSLTGIQWTTPRSPGMKWDDKQFRFWGLENRPPFTGKENVPLP